MQAVVFKLSPGRTLRRRIGTICGDRLSTDEEIRAVYEDDIAMMSYIVERKSGKGPFFNYFKEMQIRKNHDYDPCKTRYQGEK